MLEVLVAEILAVASLGVQAVAISGWMRWQQIVAGQQDEEEEEILTPYQSKQDSAPIEEAQVNGSVKPVARDMRLNGWEFKIVRAKGDLFRHPEIFQRLCEEEAKAGWILLEKFDDCRARFKRPIALRDMIKPESLSYDPYRCYYGSTFQPLHYLAPVAALIAVIVPAYLGFTFVSSMLANSHESFPPPRTPTLPATETVPQPAPNSATETLPQPSPQPSPILSPTQPPRKEGARG
jgi:hypothetical protein